MNKKKLILIIAVLVALVFSFWYGGSAPGMHGWSVDDSKTAEETALPEDLTDLDISSPAGISSDEALGTLDNDGRCTSQAAVTPSTNSSSEAMAIDSKTGKDKYNTDPVPEGKPLPVEPQDVEVGKTAYSCTISISCSTILKHMDWLEDGKEEMVPEDGWILEPVKVTFYEGESVFNVLQRTCKQLKIHMEFENTPMYNSAYIEGINNLYEFDCGELSGWMYSVNDWFPNYGCSRYQLKDGDIIKWVFTCDLGEDVGGGYSTGT